jgi:phosphatidate cytidylyltransferase
MDASRRSALLPRVVAALVVGGAAVAAILLGPGVLLGCVIALFVVAYLELQRVLAARPSPLHIVLGAVAVGVCAWLGYAGRLHGLPWVLAGLTLALFVSRIVGVEAGARDIGGATAQVGATVTAAGIVGLLGAHVLLIRRLPRFGFSALVIFALMMAAITVFGAVGRRVGRRLLAPDLDPNRTWEATALGAVGAVAVGVAAGLLADPPFALLSGLALGAAVGILTPTGGLAVAALERGAGVKAAAAYLPGAGSILDACAGLLFSAPFFYWVLRTL